jgi:hypothetical protein
MSGWFHSPLAFWHSGTLEPSNSVAWIVSSRGRVHSFILSYCSFCRLFFINFFLIQVKMIALWDIVPCSLIEVHRYFRGAYCLQHKGPLKRRSASTKLHGVISQKVIFILEALTTWNCTNFDIVSSFKELSSKKLNCIAWKYFAVYKFHDSWRSKIQHCCVIKTQLRSNLYRLLPCAYSWVEWREVSEDDRPFGCGAV